MHERLYTELAEWWPLLSPAERWAETAALVQQVFADVGPLGSLLELGCGGGNLAAHLPAELDLVLTDLSAPMLAASRRLNPTRTHVQADMCTLDLDRRFDAVLLHDAVMYLVDEADLAAACRTAARHLHPGGHLLVVPDLVAETFVEGISAGGAGPDWGEAEGRAVRILEWLWDPDLDDTAYRIDMSLLLRDTDGTVRAVHESHTMALHPRSTYWRCLRAAGLDPVEAPALAAAQLGEAFLARLPAA